MPTLAPDPPFTAVARATRAAIAADAVAGHDAPSLLRRAMRTLDRAVAFDAASCTTTDPDTLLWTGGVLSGLPPEALGRLCELELLCPDVLPFRELARERRPVGVLSEATGGAPARAARHRELYGLRDLGDELRVAFVSRGRCYGTASLLRAHGEPDFTQREAALVAEVAPDVADGLRAAFGRARIDAGAGRPSGVLVVDDDARVLSITDQAAAWLEGLGGAPDGEPPLPAVVHAVVAQARSRAAGVAGPAAHAHALTGTGVWLSVHASALSGDHRAWAVVLAPARRGDVLRLLADAHDLTPRELEVLGLLLRGNPDRAIAERLVVSPYTAREHAGRVLRKFGVRTRAELQALLFDGHREPWPQDEPAAAAA